jgi:GGDEF domain-containing protein
MTGRQEQKDEQPKSQRNVLVLVRHGESEWNRLNRFTGSKDVGLTEEGLFEAHRAGAMLEAEGLRFDFAFTSTLKRAQHSFYSTPLTGLPGGRLIEDTLRDRFNNDKPFSFGYLDLDNFKYFNDTYGYVKGDRVIMQTAYMLYTTISRHGNRDDFIGHIGGDDFAFITTPDKHSEVCQNFIADFNRIMPFHYCRENRDRGYIVARDRTHKIKNIPLMGVSIAVVNKTELSQFKNIIEINEKIAEVKRYLKGFDGSKFMADRRSGGPDGRQSPRIFRIESGSGSAYRPLGQILLERGAINGERLDEALTVHWRRGVRLGETLKDLGYVAEKDIKEALKEGEALLSAQAKQCEGNKHGIGCAA